MTINSAAVVINAGSTLWIPIVIVKPKSTLSWSFTIKEYNCAFGVSFSQNSTGDDVIIPREVYECNKEVSNSIVIDNPTTVYLYWDNSYSWIRSKTILYSISIEQPRDILLEKRIASTYASVPFVNRTFYEDIHESNELISKLEQSVIEKERECEDIRSMMKQTRENYDVAVVRF